MGNLADDTAVSGGDGRYVATLREDWNIWGPNGGYLAAVALRAAGAHSSQPRPASLMCHFLGVAAFDDVELEVVTLRAARRAEAMRVSMTQGGRPMLEALVWTVADELDGLVHDMAVAPGIGGPDDYGSIDDLAPDRPTFPFWGNIEHRPFEFIEDWDTRPASDPEYLGWLRFRPQATFDDAYVDAARLAILVDTFQWPAATRAYAGGSLAHVAPSLDLACRFHRAALDQPWLLVHATSPVAEGGLVAGTASVFDAAGRLVASGGQQMLCRPMAPTDMPR